MSTEEQIYELGYKTELKKEQKIEFRTLFIEKSYTKGVFFTFFHITSIYVAFFGLVSTFSVASYVTLKVAMLLFVIVFATRQMRALENIVHFGSHNNFSKKRITNDRLTNVLAAWPMMQEVNQYRKFHSVHHGQYGSHDDPCRIRFEAIGVSYSDVTTKTRLIRAIIRWMPAYVIQYYREVKSARKQVSVFILWHFMTTLLLSLMASYDFAIVSLVGWMLCMFIFLPFLRSVAEFSEHDYERGCDVKETTFNNLRPMDRLILHPAGDAYHALHHFFPSVPWWKQGAAHRYLMINDPCYQTALHRN